MSIAEDLFKELRLDEYDQYEPSHYDELIHILEKHLTLAVQAEREACVRVVETSVKCRTCKTVFLESDGHDCEYPNWDGAKKEDIAAAIRARS